MQKHEINEGGEMAGASATATSLPGSKAINIELIVGANYVLKTSDNDFG
jgi:hypothetical protein